MPELPEVETARRFLSRVMVNRQVLRVECARDPLVLPDARAVRRALEAKRVEQACRHGKWLWLEMSAPPHPLFHFGMTGSFRMRDDVPQRLRSSPSQIDRTFPPRFTKVLIVLDDGHELAFTNARRLGRVIARMDPRGEPPISKLGFDPLTSMPSEAVFHELVARRRGTLKGLLLDQSFAAGVGNWVADEVLYQARLDPRRSVCSLDVAETRRLRSRLVHVIEVAVEAGADADRYPRGWLFHHRWTRGTHTSQGETVEHTTIAGRTTAWVPVRQH